MKPALAIATLALALAGLTAAPSAGAQRRSAAAAAEDGMNHAAVVVDTGDGTVRKMCLAFPEAELSGIEALRRVDTRPSRFETFAGKGSGVCMLCGVGCPSGDCFCDPNKYWAYHRAGPSETQYKTSPLGASSTIVRDGDVEAWKWGNGSAPSKTTVSDVCGVPEPPARTAATTTSTTSDDSPTTTASPSPSTSSPTPTDPPATIPGAPRPGGTGSTTPPLVTAVTDPVPSEEDETPVETGAPEELEDRQQADERAVADSEPGGESSNIGQIASLGAFTALLGALLVWRSRLRRANMRRVRPVR